MFSVDNKDNEYFRRNYFNEIRNVYMTHTSTMYDHQQSLITNMESTDSIEYTERNSDLKKVQYMQVKLSQNILVETREFQSANALDLQYHDIHAQLQKIIVTHVSPSKSTKLEKTSTTTSYLFFKIFPKTSLIRFRKVDVCSWLYHISLDRNEISMLSSSPTMVFIIS